MQGFLLTPYIPIIQGSHKCTACSMCSVLYVGISVCMNRCQTDTGIYLTSLKWCYISSHQQLYCLFHSLFKPTTKKTSKLYITDPLWGNPPVTGRFPSQRATNVERISMSWHHHMKIYQLSTISYNPVTILQKKITKFSYLLFTFLYFSQRSD